MESLAKSYKEMKRFGWRCSELGIEQQQPGLGEALAVSPDPSPASLCTSAFQEHPHHGSWLHQEPAKSRGQACACSMLGLRAECVAP